MSNRQTPTGDGAVPLRDPLRASARRLTSRYLLALGLIAGLALVSFLLLHGAIAAQDANSTFVNISGRQRMLSQRAAMFAERLVLEGDPGAKALVAAELAGAAAMMQRSHAALLRGDADLGLPARPLSAPLRDIYFGAGAAGLDARIRAYLERVDALLREDAGGLPGRSREHLRAIRAMATEQLLGALDAAVKQYAIEARADVGRTVLLHGLVLLGTLTALGLEACLIFRPMVRRIVADTQRLLGSERELQHRAHHDPLTGLPNRVLFAERLEAAARQACGCGATSAVLWVDLDRFKEVNDTLGHAAGDRLLELAAQRLRAAAGGSATVARLGGDEFAVLLAGLAGPDDAAATCRRILDGLGPAFELGKARAQVSASIGVAILPGDARDGEAAMRCADLALYRAKNDGRGEFRFYDAGLAAELRADKLLEDDLRHGLERGEFELHFQPQHASRDLGMVGVEALVRWRRPGHGLVLPGGFIPVAERTGLIQPLGAWVLEEACSRAAAWPGVTVAVNVSPVQLRDRRFASLVAGALARSALPAHRLELEITEGVLLGDTGTVRRVLGALKSLGVRLVMDDFGTGYSSLASLQTYSFDRVKIDRSFVGRLDEGEGAAEVVRAIVALACGLGLQITAEGVETAAQLAFLRDAGCGELQGYHLSRPQPAIEIDEAFERQASVARDETGNGRLADAALFPVAG